MRMFAGRIAGIAAVVVVLASPAAAGAAWQAIPPPPGGISTVDVADADTWLVQPEDCCESDLSVTGDRGGSWAPVSLPGFTAIAVAGAAPDRSFRVVGWRIGGGSREVQVFRVEPGGGFEALGPALEDDSNVFSDIYAVTGSGATWVPWRDGAAGVFRLTVVEADGSSSTRALPNDPPADRWLAERTAFGPRLSPIGGDGAIPGMPRKGIFKLAAAGEVVPAEHYPVEFADGDLWLAPGAERASWDGGAHWSEIHDFALVVPRAESSIEPPRYLSARGELLQRHSPFLYRRTGFDWPEEFAPYRVVDAGHAFVTYGDSAIYVHDGPPPPAPTEIGFLSPMARTMIGRADLFRADAGLPPLIGDALISQASHNHSHYTALNGGEGAHRETPGLPGFTGVDLLARCAAVGTSCRGEVMFSPVPDPVGGWLATPYHRFVPGSPEGGNVGAGMADGGSAVMNSGASANLLIRPFGYPNGRWRGDSGFSGETPDPVEACHRSGQAIEYPVGIAVSLYMPGYFGGVRRIEVRRSGSPIPLPGCLLHDSDDRSISGIFLLDEPLEPGQTYHARGEWSPEAEHLPDGTSIAPPVFSHEWSFTSQPDGYGASGVGGSSCKGASLRRIRTVVRSKRPGRRGMRKGLQTRLVFSQPARVRLRRAALRRPAGRSRGKRKRWAALPLARLARREVGVKRRSTLTLRLPNRLARRFGAGEKVQLRLTMTTRRSRGCQRQRSFTRRVATRVGWVRQKRAASLRSATRKRRGVRAKRQGHTRRTGSRPR